MAGPQTFATRNRSPFWFQNVNAQSMGPGIISAWNVPVGQTYLTTKVYFYVGTVATAATDAQIVSDVTLISIKVNGIIITTMTGQQALALEKFYRAQSLPANTGILTLFWERPWFQDVNAQRSLAWGMYNQNSFEIDITLGGTDTVTGMTMWHKVDPVVSALGRHVEVTTQSETFTGTGPQYIIDFPQNDSSNLPDAILAFHLELFGGVTKADVSNIIVECDKIQLYNINPNLLENSYGEATSYRTPQADYLSVDFTQRNRVDGQLWLCMNTLKITINWTSAPGTYNTIIERLTGVPGLPATTPAAGASA